MDILKQFTIYLSEEKKLSQVTVRNYVVDIAQFIRWYEKGTKRPFIPKDILPSDIEQYKTTTFLSSRSLVRHLSSLRKFFRFLIVKGMVLRDPISRMAQKETSDFDLGNVKDFGNYLYVYNASPLTIKYYTSDVKHFLLWFSQKNIHRQITQQFVCEYIKCLIDQSKYSQGTLNRKQAAIKKYFCWKQMEN